MDKSEAKERKKRTNQRGRNKNVCVQKLVGRGLTINSFLTKGIR